MLSKRLAVLAHSLALICVSGASIASAQSFLPPSDYLNPSAEAGSGDVSPTTAAVQSNEWAPFVAPENEDLAAADAAMAPQWGEPGLRRGEWYFAWGSNKEWWAPTNIHVSQPALGNDFTLHQVRGHDEPGLDLGSLLTEIFGPQYNFRIGRFVNETRTIAVELNFDHTKYTATENQMAFLTGTIGGAPANGTYRLDDNFFAYRLHNGANHLMANAVYRRPLFGQLNESFSVAGIAKVGAGLMIPHTSDVILGNPNDVGPKTFSNSIGFHRGWWQLDGWTTGVELGFRITLWKPVYLEITDKVAYSHLSDLPAYQGTLSHSLWLNELTAVIGFAYGGSPRR